MVGYTLRQGRLLMDILTWRSGEEKGKVRSRLAYCPQIIKNMACGIFWEVKELVWLIVKTGGCVKPVRTVNSIKMMICLSFTNSILAIILYSGPI